MSIDWDGYAVYEPGVTGPLELPPRGEARQAFKRLMLAKPARIGMLRRLLKAHGVELGASDAVIQISTTGSTPTSRPTPASLAGCCRIGTRSSTTSRCSLAT